MTFDLTGQLLISTPAIGDPRFARAVIYLCAHSDEGAFGLVVNRAIAGLSLPDVLKQLSIPVQDTTPEAPVLMGGPVENSRGFVLHSHDPRLDDSGPELPGGLALSASSSILEAIARGEGPQDWLLALGYSGWGAGQLEDEILKNAWLTCDTRRSLIFTPTPGEAQWSAALHSMGVDPVGLSSVAGLA